jgi:putative membrane protein
MKRVLALLMLTSPIIALGASNPDALFFKHAAEGGIFEVDAGTLAQDKGSEQNIKDFGAMMVKDHSAANDKLKAIAAAKNLDLPTSASIPQMADKAKLEVLSGKTFDKSYIKGEIKAHRETIAMFRKEAATGQDAQAKAFAVATLPTLKSHLKSIEGIAASAGVSTK